MSFHNFSTSSVSTWVVEDGSIQPGWSQREQMTPGQCPSWPWTHSSPEVRSELGCLWLRHSNVSLLTISLVQFCLFLCFFFRLNVLFLCQSYCLSAVYYGLILEDQHFHSENQNRLLFNSLSWRIIQIVCYIIIVLFILSHFVFYSQKYISVCCEGPSWVCFSGVIMNKHLLLS